MIDRRTFQNCLVGAAAAAAVTSIAPHVSHAASKNGKIRIGQIGTSHAHAAGKLESYRSMSDVYEVVGVVEPDAAQRERVQKQRAYADLPWLTEEQLLNTSGLQAVAVETEVCDLVPKATRCVQAGLHVHVDKPAGESMSAVRTLHEEASRRKLTVQMGYMFRYNPAFQFLFQAARDGWLGEVFEVHATMSKKLGERERKELLPYKGGSMFELGCHVVDQLVTLLGPPQKVTPYPRQVRPDLDTLVDNQLAVFEYPKATATVRSAMVEHDGGRRRQFVACGTEGTIEILPIEAPKLMATFSKKRGEYAAGHREIPLPKMTGRYDGEFQDLAAVIRGEKQFAWSAAHDLATHESILRASSLPLDT
ncbi:MAG: Gfo/Idh/MocA family oxidoreductase [Planctomycetes bacterium]|nr:Gfo/Idh/MocA family oxidoreductase [Planctomycetota bacterium]